jgi:hypothetical protein
MPAKSVRENVVSIKFILKFYHCQQASVYSYRLVESVVTMKPPILDPPDWTSAMPRLKSNFNYVYTISRPYISVTFGSETKTLTMALCTYLAQYLAWISICIDPNPIEFYCASICCSVTSCCSTPSCVVPKYSLVSLSMHRYIFRYLTLPNVLVVSWNSPMSSRRKPIQ